MAVGNVYTTFDAAGNATGAKDIGIRESLADKIYMISPTETPFLTMCRKVKAEATYEEWLIDELAAAVDTNAAVEGDEATVDALTPGERVGNRCQILDKAFGVSGTLEAVKKAGRAKEMAYQLSKKAAELKRDLEMSLLANNTSVAGPEGTAREMGGFPAWFETNVDFDGGGANGGFAAGTVTARTNGAARAFAESMVTSMMQSAWDEGGMPSTLLLGAKQRGVFSGFQGIATDVKTEAAQKKIIATADVYVSDFGTLRVVADRYIRKVGGVDYDVFGVDPNYVEVAELRTFRQHELAKTGDSDRRQLLWEGTLKVLNEAAHFLITDLS